MNGRPGTAPHANRRRRSARLCALDAAGTRDPDGHAVTVRWWFHAEAGTGIRASPWSAAARRADGGGGGRRRGGHPVWRRLAARRALPPRVDVSHGDTARVATVTPRIAGLAHIILAVEDNGSPALTSVSASDSDD